MDIAVFAGVQVLTRNHVDPGVAGLAVLLKECFFGIIIFKKKSILPSENILLSKFILG